MIKARLEYPKGHPLYRTVTPEELADDIGITESRIAQWRTWEDPPSGPRCFKYFGRVYYKIDEVNEWLLFIGPPRMNEKMRVLMQELIAERNARPEPGVASDQQDSGETADYAEAG